MDANKQKQERRPSAYEQGRRGLALEEERGYEDGGVRDQWQRAVPDPVFKNRRIDSLPARVPYDQ